jgi:hypothetical protein
MTDLLFTGRIAGHENFLWIIFQVFENRSQKYPVGIHIEKTGGRPCEERLELAKSRKISTLRRGPDGCAPVHWYRNLHG